MQMDMAKEGRGKKRMFTRAEFFIFRNIKILRMCPDISWIYIKELKELETKYKARFTDWVKDLEQKEKDGKCKLSGDSMFIPYLTIPELNIGWSYFEEGDKKSDVGEALQFLDNYNELGSRKEAIKEQIDVLALDLKNFDGYYQWFHRALPDEESFLK